ncbi:MAG: hypothetical protein IKS66_02055 [Oscillospiraceae bacterium]|nr:hypothetical protein [Oscillospiraceae bacterium]
MRENEAWLSDSSIRFGTGFFESLSEAIDRCDCGLFFLTKDNIHQSWINFEAGGMFFSEKKLWCILTDDIKKEDLFDSPFGQIQAIHIKKEAFEKLFKSICKNYSDNWDAYKARLKEHWSGYSKRVKEILKQGLCNKIDIICTNEVVSHFVRLQNDLVESSTVTSIPCGFETHDLYEYVLSNCKKRLWIFGRKNKKMFDASHGVLLKELGRKIAGGLDFKCLFFDKQLSGYSEKTMQNRRNFKKALETSIDDALDRCEEADSAPGECFRYYSEMRNIAMIIFDDTVLYAHVTYKLDGTPAHLTNAPFYIADIETKIGRDCSLAFLDTWERSRKHE